MSPDRLTKKQKQDRAREELRLKREELRARKRRQRWMVQGGLIVGMLAVLTIATFVVISVTRPPSPGPLNMLSDGILFTGNATATTVVATRSIPAGSTPVPTDPTAHKSTVNIVTYIDYQCPYCKQFEATNAAQIQQWLTSGVASLEVHPIAILDRSSQGTKYSTRAANAAACVANFDPNHFLAVNTALYAQQPAEGTTGLTDSALTTLVSGAGAAGKDVASCIQNQTFAGWVTAATQRANAGPIPNSTEPKVNSTPTVLVNGTKYTGSITDPAAFSAFVAQAAVTKG